MNHAFTTLETASLIWGGIILTAIIFSIYTGIRQREEDLNRHFRFAPKKNFRK